MQHHCLSGLCSTASQQLVLGPFLFIIAINDFVCNMDCKSVFYADDMSLLNSSPNLEHLRTEQVLVMETAVKWCESNFLILNNNKTENNNLFIK